MTHDDKYTLPLSVFVIMGASQLNMSIMNIVPLNNHIFRVQWDIFYFSFGAVLLSKDTLGYMYLPWIILCKLLCFS